MNKDSANYDEDCFVMNEQASPGTSQCVIS